MIDTRRPVVLTDVHHGKPLISPPGAPEYVYAVLRDGRTGEMLIAATIQYVMEQVAVRNFRLVPYVEHDSAVELVKQEVLYAGAWAKACGHPKLEVWFRSAMDVASAEGYSIGYGQGVDVGSVRY
jgi:hypothetical protein